MHISTWRLASHSTPDLMVRRPSFQKPLLIFPQDLLGSHGNPQCSAVNGRVIRGAHFIVFNAVVARELAGPCRLMIK